MTNFERIKQMTIEEMAVFINTLSDNCCLIECTDCVIYQAVGNCEKDCILSWLNQEEEE
jgi:hypothetical protein